MYVDTVLDVFWLTVGFINQKWESLKFHSISQIIDLFDLFKFLIDKEKSKTFHRFSIRFPFFSLTTV